MEPGFVPHRAAVKHCHAEQLAIKWRKDHLNFDLDDWLRLRDPDLKAPTRVTFEDIGEYL